MDSDGEPVVERERGAVGMDRGGAVGGVESAGSVEGLAVATSVISSFT